MRSIVTITRRVHVHNYVTVSVTQQKEWCGEKNYSAQVRLIKLLLERLSAFIFLPFSLLTIEASHSPVLTSNAQYHACVFYTESLHWTACM